MLIRINSRVLKKLPSDLVLREVYALFSVRGDRLRYTSGHNLTVRRAMEEIELTSQVRAGLTWFAHVDSMPEDAANKVIIRRFCPICKDTTDWQAGRCKAHVGKQEGARLMTRYNDTANQQRIAAAAAAIVNRAAYDALPDAAKAAQRKTWQLQLRAQTGCTEKTARKHIRQLCGHDE